MNVLANLLYRRPRLEAALSAMDKARLTLPLMSLSKLFEDFDKQPVVLTDLPLGPWSSPVADTVMLAKICLCLKPRRVLEVGSYRGFTAKILAEHTPAESSIVAFDRDDRHGEAYRDTALSLKIERRVSEVSAQAFQCDATGSYDLIFLDADHVYDAVKRDTEILLPLLSSKGVFIWHDYANWGRFSKKNGVPEYLHDLARSRPIAAVEGSWLAIHSPVWLTLEGAARIAGAVPASSIQTPGLDPWSVGNVRG